MALLGHSSAEMSLRYGRLFDQTVRADYERALALAKERLGPVLPGAPTQAPDGDWRELPLIKSRLAGGYCLRTAAQCVCAYSNICEHCPTSAPSPGCSASYAEGNPALTLRSADLGQGRLGEGDGPAAAPRPPLAHESSSVGSARACDLPASD
jgi:hypothetical protein